MPIRSLIVGLAITGLVSLAGSVRAGMLASSFVNGPPAETTVICRISNVGKKPVPIVSATILDFLGREIFLAGDCSGVLAPGDSCLMGGPDDSSGRGVLVVRGSTRNLRGLCAVEDGNLQDVAQSEMR